MSGGAPVGGGERLDLNLLWCRAIAGELHRAGVRHVLLTLGGRSAAMVLTLQQDPRFETMTRVDERGAAFLALGIARTTGRPVAVVTTSGSAVANLLPALAEAAAWGTPLVLVTCDRPNEERAGGGPQSSDHLGLCAALVAAALDLPEPSPEPAALAALRLSLADTLRFALPGPAGGPVQINVPQLGRVASLDAAATRAELQLPPGEASPLAAPARQQEDLAPLIARLALRPGLRGLIVAGPETPVPPAWIAELAGASGFPLLADAASGLRRPAAPNLVALADLLVLSPDFAGEPPDLVVQVGAAPVSHGLHAYLRRHGARVLRIARAPVAADFLHAAPEILVAPSQGQLAELGAALGPGDAAWRARWLGADAALEARREAALEAAGWGDAQAAAVACNAPGFGLTLLANSMAARLGNLFCRPGEAAHPILCNRGVNGIDGTLSTFLGALVGAKARGLALIGDQAMLHDLPSLEPLAERSLDGCICLLNNKGPGIFDLSIWPEDAALRRQLRRETQIDFGPIAAGFGLAYERVGEAAALSAALERAASRDGLSLVEADLPEAALFERFGGVVRHWLGVGG
ncbi:MAG: 2-succinyl-5-enolpyruvyl-6-hydroxy-3-cyclohexene-1-carboxylic-acid synthase [Tistlia sp.]|uniref:2-succinyl-5-enolpyruvyl-6-hydroxy-3- cyclohexene-1-carboxylic-acid synthase n=1 Tax=Tistlia sp. TaxID=3057121 RepID=UPI0034A2FBC9